MPQVTVVPFPITLHPPLPSVSLPPHTLTPSPVPSAATGNHTDTEGQRSRNERPSTTPDLIVTGQTSVETSQTSILVEPDAESAPPYTEKPQYSSVYSV